VEGVEAGAEKPDTGVKQPIGTDGPN